MWKTQSKGALERWINGKRKYNGETFVKTNIGRKNDKQIRKW